MTKIIAIPHLGLALLGGNLLLPIYSFASVVMEASTVTLILSLSKKFVM